MKIFSCNAIFFPFPDHHNAAKNKQKKKNKNKKNLRIKKKNRTFSKTEFLKN